MAVNPIRQPYADLVSPQEVCNRLGEVGENLVLLDVRTQFERVFDGRIPQATWIPIEQIEARIEEEIKRDVEVIVHCAHGVRSESVARYLVYMGYENVKDMEGGLANWVGAGLPVERGL